MNVEKRLSELRNFMNANNLSLGILLDPENQYYITGFRAYLQTRPTLLIVKADSNSLIVPTLEKKKAEKEVPAYEILVYYENPERTNKVESYMDRLKELLTIYPAGTRIGIEYNIMSIALAGYLKDSGYELIDIGGKICEMRFIKDEEEIKLLIEAGKLVSLALSETIKSARVGISILEMEYIGHAAAIAEAVKKYPRAMLEFSGSTQSGIVDSVQVHVFSSTKKLQKNDIIIHSRQLALNGYRAECERTFFLGKPTDEQKKVFNLAVTAQKAALEVIRPGIKAKEVDWAARRIFQEAGYGDCAIHRIGHNIGIGKHEKPFLAFDSDFVLQEGMLFTIEPGIYVPNIGGFRHSDTLILTKDGSKIITSYPRELKDLILG